MNLNLCTFTSLTQKLLLCILLIGVSRTILFHGFLANTLSKVVVSPQILQKNENAPVNNINKTKMCNPIRSERPNLTDLPIVMPFSRGKMGKRGILRKEDLFIHRTNINRFHLTSKLNLQYFALNAQEIWSRFVWDRCAIVGNGGSLLSANHGEAINDHDIVVRFNQAPTKGFVKFVGSKTTFRILNALWTNIYAKNVRLRKDGSLDSKGSIHIGEIKNVPLEFNTTLIVSRSSPENFDKVCLAIENKRSDIQLLLLAPKVVTAAKWLLNEYRQLLCSHGYGPYPGGHTPSSGFVTIFVMLQLCKKMNLYGFGDSGTSTKYHYFSGGGHRTVGNLVHSWNSEMEMIQALHRNDFLRVN